MGNYFLDTQYIYLNVCLGEIPVFGPVIWIIVLLIGQIQIFYFFHSKQKKCMKKRRTKRNLKNLL